MPTDLATEPRHLEDDSMDAQQQQAPESLWSKIARWSAAPGVLLGEIALIVMMLVVSFDAFQRYLIDGSITGLPNLAGELLLPACVLLPLAYATRNGSHVRVGIVYEKFPPLARSIIDRFGDLVAAVLWAMVAIHMLQSALASQGVRSLTDDEVPTSWSHGVIGLGAALMFLVSLVLVIAGSSARSKEDPDAMVA